jgi:biopolymer transport protein ExbB
MEVIHTIGRRKTSFARIFLSKGKGKITVNKKNYTDYFTTATLQYKIIQPFFLTDTEGSYDLKVTVKGGGITGQRNHYMNTFLILQTLTNGASEAQTVNEVSTTDGIQQVDVSILELLLEGGIYIMAPLALMSMIAIYVFIERTLAIRKAEKVAPDFMDKIRDYISQGSFESARNLCQDSDTPMARMLDKGISRIGKDLKDISVAIENIGKLEIYNLEKNLSSLATVAGAAPMVGFLGTVIGMVNVFLDMETAGTVRVEDISSGTKQAMITTIVGLIVGIIAYMAYNNLVSKVSKVVHKMEATSIEFIDILEEPAA